MFQKVNAFFVYNHTKHKAEADATIILDGGYKVLDRDDIVEVLKASL